MPKRHEVYGVLVTKSLLAVTVVIFIVNLSDLESSRFPVRFNKGGGSCGEYGWYQTVTWALILNRKGIVFSSFCFLVHQNGEQAAPIF